MRKDRELEEHKGT